MEVFNKCDLVASGCLHCAHPGDPKVTRQNLPAEALAQQSGISEQSHQPGPQAVFSAGHEKIRRTLSEVYGSSVNESMNRLPLEAR